MRPTKFVKHIKMPMYNCTVHCIITDSMDDVVNGIFKKYKLERDVSGAAEGMVLSPDITDYYLLIDINYLSHNTISHELHHAVIKLTEDRGIVDQETQAWIAGHIAGTLYKFLDKKNITVKHGG